MPERLDRVTVATPNGDVTLSWDTRGVLLALLEQTEGTAEIRARFEAVGASRPVELNRDERLALGDLLGGEWLMDDEVLPNQGAAHDELTALYIAVNMGEPHAAIVEMFNDGYGYPNWRWRWTHWRDRQDPNDTHQHCVFCHTNIEDDAVTEAWRALTDDGYEQWVCAGCFDKLQARFGMKVDPLIEDLHDAEQEP